MDKSEIEFLKNCLAHTFGGRALIPPPDTWYLSGDTVLTVAEILDGECYFHTTGDVIRYFEKPWKWETDMQEIVDTYEHEDDDEDEADEDTDE